MTFVFEARRLPFGTFPVAQILSECNGNPNHSDGCPSLNDEALEGLPAWKRRLIPPVIDVVRKHYGKDGGNDEASSLSCWSAVLSIVDELQELEAAYARMIEYRERQRRGEKTAEECMLEELLRERIGDDFMRGRHTRGGSKGCDGCESSSGSDEDVYEDADIAMCFNTDGTVVGIGSAGLFGGHGYHLHPSGQ
ncbi:hypothetical protein DPX39_110100400 [Trypanosoma brucei equiperdum]|uniref:Uncharacterized protein n=1 Tax=Trypanosoma brucei equiperdum TaxID=630700 RepID=A0A3L6KW32_9TRYP|nr:hypothetical protein DPX39_110100400 [Trypanosoma brucei equiperdum]